MKKFRSVRFPDPRLAGPEGVLCFGGDLEVGTLLEAYGQGIFPWPQEGLPLLWFSPPARGVLDFSELHWSRRFTRALKDDRYELMYNRSFREVVRNCAQVPRTGETGTWILPEMQAAYFELHDAGHAHSVECWRGEVLVGGLYGVYIGGVFSGESMFFKESDASKRCLHGLTEVLARNGVEWMDIQMVTPVLERLGGKYISREEFLLRLSQARKKHPAILDFGL